MKIEQRSCESPLKLFLRLASYFRPHLKEMTVALFLMGFMTVASLARPMILRLIIDRAVPAGNIFLVIEYSALFVALLVAGAFIGYYQLVLMSKVGLKIVNRMKSQLFRKILSLDLAFFDENQVGWIISRVESDTEQLKNFCSYLTIRFVLDSLVFIGIIAVLYWNDAAIAGRISVILLMLLMLVTFFLSRMREIYDRVRTGYAELTGFISEYIQGVPVIQLYNRKKEIRKELALKNQERYRSELRAMSLEYGFWAFIIFLMETVLISIILYTGIGKVIAGSLSVGTLVMFIEYIRQMISPIQSMGELFNAVQRSFVSARRVFGILDMEPKITAPVPATGKRIDFNEIVFDRVDFAYRENEIVLRNISFKIKKGEKIALVGPSGSGKTTTASLLMRFYDPLRGRILVDGRDLRELPLEDWRRGTGLVLQEIYLFPGNVKDNLSVLDETVSMERIKNAACRLGSDSFIEKLPAGYETELTERGSNLSMGERQLLSFTRALTFEPELLILDEATASIDPYTEAMLQQALDRLLEGRTALIIAHRLSTIRKADRIIVFDAGEIKESGTHEELLKRNGLYRKLHDLQLAGTAEYENSSRDYSENCSLTAIIGEESGA